MTSKARWLVRFAFTLQAAFPGLQGVDAIDLAERQWLEQAEIEPEEAARRFALDDPPGHLPARRRVRFGRGER